MKPDYWYKQSAVIPYLIEDGEINIVLITSRRKKRWIVPKGIIEPDMTPEESAAKEALEEAGVSGIVMKKKLGEYKREKWDGECCIEVYPLEVVNVLDDWLEVGVRTRKIVKLDDAVKLIDDNELKNIMKKLGKALKKKVYA